MINKRTNTPPHNLWALSAKLKGIAHLVQAQDAELPPALPECWYGVGELIFEIAAELDTVRDQIEGTSFDVHDDGHCDRKRRRG